MNIPGYQIKKELGRGGMAVVYLAYQESLRRDVALKVMQTKSSMHEEFATRFLQEGQTLANLIHPNIIPVFDTGIHDGQYYLSMQYLAGGTLEERLEQHLTAAQTKKLITSIAEALVYAHSKNIVHRDIKPSNILFYEDGTPALADFGIAKVIDQSGVAAKGTMTGTPAYMSPEQWKGSAIDGRADLYALGVVMYELLTGELPYVGSNAMMQHLEAPIPKLPPKLAAFQTLIDQLLAKNPEDRFTSATQFIAALENTSLILNDSDKTAISPSPIIDKSEQSNQATPKQQQEPPKKRRSPLFIGVGIAVALAALLIAGYFYLDYNKQRHDDDAYTLARKRNTKDAYQDYLANCATWGCAHKLEAETALAKILEPEMPETPFAEIPAGSFDIGSSPDEKGSDGNEQARRRITIAPFLLNRYEVTVGEFQAFVEATNYRTDAEKNKGCFVWKTIDWRLDPEKNWRDPGFSQKANEPVVCVSWNDAMAYADWLSKENRASYRLPTEAEWEYAARAGTTTARYWGDAEQCQYAAAADQAAQVEFNWNTLLVANCDDGYSLTAPVGSFKPNAFGLYDMLGNVWEWTCSSYDAKYGGAEQECSANSFERVFRGGAWSDGPEWVRAAQRGRNSPNYPKDNIGFRLAKSLQ